MLIVASIQSKVIRISGWPNSGWSVADSSDPSCKELPFHFAVTGDGDGGFLLAYHSLDNVYIADSSHPTIEHAYACAEQQFGIKRHEWTLRARV
jgi:hypothetical protein